ncbi:hypothetical protein EV138_1249 [Kribbella voronezhensis]|uniref:Uncharacterized protein n=1 Tax=Kribbella voronezhensis TaxID=2512212 RepID=A0A4R7T734_9ACTN|nr:hypothetical protein [Kribbella voronezhensis]TDU87722.1 hypothetical protein EV138_1249 [Kribbella voronezhensis]
MKNVFRTVRIVIAATAVVLVGAGTTIASAAADQHGTSATVTVAGPDQPECIGCWG